MAVEPGSKRRAHEWQADVYSKQAEREALFETVSGHPVRPLYTDEDLAEWEAERDLGFPGEPPYTRGVYPSMYRGRLWTMRQFAGFGTAEETNQRFRYLLDHGQTGLSTAFDMPTLMGLDSDHARSSGEVGLEGVAIDTLDDMIDLFAGIPMDRVTTSMTINAPAAILLAFYVCAAEEQGLPPEVLGGTIQTDILKEYIAQKEWCFPIEPAMRLVSDMVEWCSQRMPRWHPISISGYHIREAGSTAQQELAFTLKDGFTYVEQGIERGLEVDDFAPRLSFFFNAHIDFFEEIAKYRAARRIWARWLRDRYGAKAERSLQMRFHTQTAGVSLTAQQPEVNIVRTAIEALAGVLGGTQSLHTNSMDETFALPTERAARIALRTQQVIANETRVANVADPLGGSWYVEALTEELERRAEEVFARVDELGAGSMLDGAVRGVEEGWFQSEIADSAYELERKLNAGRHVIVGVTQFLEGNDEPPPETLRIGPEVEEEQRRRLEKVRNERDPNAVARALTQVRSDAAEPTTNLMPALLDAARAYATLGEIVEALAGVFGRWVEQPRICSARRAPRPRRRPRPDRTTPCAAVNARRTDREEARRVLPRFARVPALSRRPR